MELLNMMIGVWEGHGTAFYPTIDTFAYRDWIQVRARASDDAVIYEQQTCTAATDGSFTNPSHWETGFLVPQDDGSVVALTAHDPRTEVLKGTPERTDDGWAIELTSTSFSNDLRMVAARRRLFVEPDAMHYTMDMSTDRVPGLTAHLEGGLQRQSA